MSDEKITIRQSGKPIGHLSYKPSESRLLFSWNGQSIEFKNIEEAKSAAILLASGIMQMEASK